MADSENPLISEEKVKIIEAAIPKYTMQQLLSLGDRMYLTLKNTEYWMKKRGNKQRSKEKHFEFAKELFKIWDADGGGFLDVDEISLPLIALGLSTDTGFVEKLIKALKRKKPSVANARSSMESKATLASLQSANEAEVEDLSFTLKDFVSIFQADRIGERISRKVKEVCRQKQERKIMEELSNSLKHQSTFKMGSPSKADQKDLLIQFNASTEGSVEKDYSWAGDYTRKRTMHQGSNPMMILSQDTLQS